MRTVILAATALVYACGDLKCAKADRDGTYRVETTELSGGTCGEVGTLIVQMSKGTQTTGQGCAIDFERWSENDCKLERSVTCVDGGSKVVGVGFTNQLDDEGKEFEGTLTTTVRDASTNAIACVSTYDVTYKRQ